MCSCGLSFVNRFPSYSSRCIETPCEVVRKPRTLWKRKLTGNIIWWYADWIYISIQSDERARVTRESVYHVLTCPLAQSSKSYMCALCSNSARDKGWVGCVTGACHFEAFDFRHFPVKRTIMEEIYFSRFPSRKQMLLNLDSIIENLSTSASLQ